ncbi:MAG: malto-oligosyltrehalose synthase [Thermoguttaceae bacterium]
MSEISAWAQWIAQSAARTVGSRLCRPTATYRIQFKPLEMTFHHAAGIVPYLQELGISHLYASPYIKARTGCDHGYAIVDYTQLNPELGGEKDYRAMVEALHGCAMGQILDTVPNHMSATPAENLWWNDVLENGPASPHAAYFDIDWHPIKEELRNKILLPILGNQYGQVLESGELKLEYGEGAFSLRYYQLLLPIDPRTYQAILVHGLDALKESQPTDSEDLRELESIVTALEYLPERTNTDPASIAERQREKEVIKGRLRTLLDRSAAVADFIAQNLRQFNGTPDEPHSYDNLDNLLDAQTYRLSHWKAADDEINYRRFFDINELAAVCMETPEVFAESHRLVFDLLVRGDVDGLRVDHIDGLYDPMEYLSRLQKGYLLALGKAIHQQATESIERGASAKAPSALTEFEAPAGPPPQWNEIEPLFLPTVTELTCFDRQSFPLYVVAEKILGANETLPEQWWLDGTTGYDFLNSANRLFLEPSGLAELTKIYRRFIDQRLDFREVAHQSKLLIFRTAMSSDLQLLAHRLNRISERHRRCRDFTLNTLRLALREILACFPVYRTYIHEGCVSEYDRQVVYRAVAQAKRRNPATNAAVFDFIRDVLVLETPPDLDESGRHERELFVGRFQQVTSPVMAKGIEDTAFYRHFPLVSMNEVGADHSNMAASLDEFHRLNIARQGAWPSSLVCTSTHDTKRSEDTRTRIDVLSEIPLQWRKAVNRWARLNRRHHREVDGQMAPSRNDEYLFYQNLVGVWPLEPCQEQELHDLESRMAIYMEKATREAKLHTSWINPNSEYDAAVRGFVEAALKLHSKNRFLDEFRRFHEVVVNWGLYSALSQTLLKLASPGVPDIYQGQEIWNFSLVDPDNRRPVDFAAIRKMLTRLRKDIGRNNRWLASLARTLAQNPRDPRIKLFLTRQVLRFRRQYADLFLHGEYIPLDVEGTKARHLCAFARQWFSPSSAEPMLAIVIAPRLIAQLAQSSAEVLQPTGFAVWEDTKIILKNANYSALQNLFTGQMCSVADSRIAVAEALADFPVGLLTNLPII